MDEDFGFSKKPEDCSDEEWDYLIITEFYADAYKTYLEESWGGGWCVPVAAIAMNVLEMLNTPAEVVICDALVFPKDQKRYSSSITKDNHNKDSIGGHAVVVTNSGWLLDPSIIQVNSLQGPTCSPVVVKLQDIRRGGVGGGYFVDQKFDTILYKPQAKPYKKGYQAVEKARKYKDLIEFAEEIYWVITTTDEELEALDISQ